MRGRKWMCVATEGKTGVRPGRDLYIPLSLPLVS